MMRSILPIRLLMLFSFLWIWEDLGATHIVGGDIAYRCLGGNRYEVSLTLRRDCLNGNPGAQFDNPAALGIFDTLGNLQRNLASFGVLFMRYRSDDTLNEILVKACGIIGGDVCVHTTTYRDTLELPFLPGGYILAYQRCCRNYTIRNIVDPLSSGATYTVHLSEDALLQCNASPVLSPYPPVYICGGQPISFALGAKDPDGDSLVYKLCTPYLGADRNMPKPTNPSPPPYAPVVFSNPYRLEDMIGGTPALGIDPRTGLMTGFAVPLVAQYLIAYCVEEYRDGKLLSVLRRDFQINVRICSSVPVADFDGRNDPCAEPANLTLNDRSTDLFSSIVQWDWKVVWHGNTLTSNDRNPQFNLGDTGIAEVQLIIRSQELCEDTISRKFRIRSIKPELNLNPDTLCRGESSMLVRSFDPEARYQWSPSTGLSCTDCPNPEARPDQTTLYRVVTNIDSCSRTDSIRIIVRNCVVDSCSITIRKTCLPNGMVEVLALDAFGRPVQAKSRQHELFWNIRSAANHPNYTWINQNPVLLFSKDVFQLTSKIYSWEPRYPKTIEFADICQRVLLDSADLNCAGPCAKLEFILSSCKDDYDIENQLDFPASICESVCSGACQYIIALFETNGQLVNPNDYDIRWSTGGKGAYVMLMGNYYNTLTVEVRKGDCVWRGRYWKSCNGYEATSPSGERSLLNPTTGMISDLEMQQLKADARSVQVTNLWGQQWTIRAEHLDRLE
ncbi:MAG TPA: hypothetical protein VFX48_05655, partial [Saprospiraceae bacterium]|nr:hypothetical protein [Saprospiraceae bacterium]